MIYGALSSENRRLHTDRSSLPFLPLLIPFLFFFLLSGYRNHQNSPLSSGTQRLFDDTGLNKKEGGGGRCGKKRGWLRM